MSRESSTTQRIVAAMWFATATTKEESGWGKLVQEIPITDKGCKRWKYFPATQTQTNDLQAAKVSCPPNLLFNAELKVCHSQIYMFIHFQLTILKPQGLSLSKLFKDWLQLEIIMFFIEHFQGLRLAWERARLCAEVVFTF